MANNKKRVLSLLVAAVMMLSTLPMNASAFFYGDRAEDTAREGRLVCENENHHDHTAACGHQHNTRCMMPQSSCYKWFRLTCKHRGFHCGKNGDALECGFQAHNSDCYAAADVDVNVDIDDVLADRELGLKIGRVITRMTGLNAEKAASKNSLVRNALVAAVQMSSLSKSQKDDVIGLVKSDENGMLRVINWLWPTYTVQFIVDGEVVECDTVEHGAMPSFDGEEPTKAEDTQYTYTFTGWDADFAPVTENVTYTARFDEIAKEHTVIFKDYKGNVIDTVTVLNGEAVTAPELAARKGYVFTGWGEDLSCVTGDMELTAQYGYEYLESSRLKINVGNGIPASGSTEGNHLSHWGKIYNARSYYSYYDYPNYKGDSIMSIEDFDYARTSAEAIPGDITINGVVYVNVHTKGTSDNYYLLLDNGTYVSCKGQYHLDYKAEFHNIVTFMVDGVAYKVDVLNGTAAECPVVPTKEGYTFIGWDKDFSKVDGSMTVTAQFEAIESEPEQSDVYSQVKIILTMNGTTRRIVRLYDVEYGTVVTGQWLIDNGYLGMEYTIADDVVIDHAGEYSVEIIAR